MVVWTAVYSCTNGACPAHDAADTVDANTARAFDGTLATQWVLKGTAPIPAEAGTFDKFWAIGEMNVYP